MIVQHTKQTVDQRRMYASGVVLKVSMATLINPVTTETQADYKDMKKYNT